MTRAIEPMAPIVQPDASAPRRVLSPGTCGGDVVASLVHG